MKTPRAITPPRDCVMSTSIGMTARPTCAARFIHFAASVTSMPAAIEIGKSINAARSLEFANVFTHTARPATVSP